MSSNTIKQTKSKIIEHEVSETSCRLLIDAPEIARVANPGQFVHVLCGGSCDPLLRRPFSIYRAESESGQIAILYEIRGRGTALLAEKKPGDDVDLIGPLGKGFELPASGDQPVMLVGGGIGMPPLYFLAQRIATTVGHECMTFHMGAQTASKHVCYDEWFYFCGEDENKYWPATDDGSIGEQCLVTDLLRKRLEASAGSAQPLIYACGPIPMLKAVAGIAKENGAKCQVSLEAKMACGVGACMGCVIKVRDGDGFKYVRVCHEGPVFDAAEVIWDE
jgi:dihydroorotate dehydrogenase electron transfer subunit